MTDRGLNLRIEYVPADRLIPDPRNARKHGKKQIERLTAAIREFGFTNPILVDERSQIIAGHARLEAAALVPLAEVPCVRIRGLSEAARKALAIADNKLGDMSEFDMDVLSATLAELESLSFDWELTGFDTAEFDVMLDAEGGIVSDAGDPADVLPEPDPGACPVSRPGDLWQLGHTACIAVTH